LTFKITYDSISSLMVESHVHMDSYKCTCGSSLLDDY
jgi:hypothetical protein